MAPSGWCSAQGRRLGWPAQDRTLPATRRSLGPHEVLILERGALEVDDPLGKASILWPSAFFMIQLSHLYMTTGNIIAYMNLCQ